jgi:2-hydroxy-6-oxonona-2,4-dienedioate hydrolase
MVKSKLDEDRTAERPALLFLHGMFSRESDWIESVNYFRDSWRVVAPKLPVCDLPREETGVSGLCQFVKDHLDELGIDRAIPCGNSLGGHIALLLALEQPKRFPALVLAGSSGLFERGFERGVPLRPSAAWLRERMSQVFYDSKHVTEDLIKDVQELLFNPRQMKKILRVAKSAKQNNLREQLHRIACPVSLIWGTNDVITPPSVAHEFNEFLPNSELHFIEQCGHAPTLERPVEFNRILEAALVKEFGPA